MLPRRLLYRRLEEVKQEMKEEMEVVKEDMKTLDKKISSVGTVTNLLDEKIMSMEEKLNR